MIGLLGRKFGMTQIFDASGNNVPVTVIETGPCVVTAIRTEEKHGYSAVQIGFSDIVERKVKKAKLGQFKKDKIAPKKFLKEIRTEKEKVQGLKLGDKLSAGTFQAGDYVDISGTSIGKGFQGVVKRHHFVGGKRSHGSMFGRVPGSIGASSFPSRVVKGMRAAGHLGNAKVTLQNVQVIDVNPEKNILLVRGQVPGFEGQLLVIKNSKKLGKKDKTWKTEEAFDDKKDAVVSQSLKDATEKSS